MLIVSIDNLKCLSDKLFNLFPDAIELRLDLFPEEDLAKLTSCTISSPIALFVAIKPSLNKNYDLTQILKNIAPQYIDLDCTLFFRFEPMIKKICPNAKIIVSKHTSHAYEIKKFFKKFQKADYKKLVIETDNTALALSTAILAKKHDLILFTGGARTSFTRFFSKWHYCFYENPTAKGQFSLKQLRALYSQSHKITKFFALIGEPLDHSISHITHNYILKVNKLDFIYLKIPLKTCRLREGLGYLKKLGCHGLSITTPHKQTAYKILTKKTGQLSINTWDFEKKLETNTDILALKEALDSVDHGNSILLLGNGACSKAFQSYFKLAKIPYTLWSRKNPIPLQSHYQVIINATASEDPLDSLPKAKLLINLFHQVDSPKIEIKALVHECLIFSGKKFFLAQAAKQLEFFFQKKFQLDETTLLSLVKVYKPS